MLSYTRPIPGVIHVRATSQFELTSTFIRPQEFYESPFPEIRGKYPVSIDDIAKSYTNRGKPFDYFSKWNGFNIPGTVVREWLVANWMLTEQEQKLSALLHSAWSIGGVDYRRFYLIGTWRFDEIRHELAHALWHLDRDYSDAAFKLVLGLRADDVRIYELVERFLLERGYARSVIPDEVNAYLGEAGLDYWQAKLGEADGHAVYHAGKPFRDLLQKHLMGYSYGQGVN